jgi:hypothetical protein
MNILFWNIKNKPEDKVDALIPLIALTDPDLLFVAEGNDSFDLNIFNSQYLKVHFNGSYSGKKVIAFAKSSLSIKIREYYFNGRIALCLIDNSGEEIAICGIHFWSKVEEFNQIYNTGKLRNEIYKLCSTYKKIVFIGDFNLAPWDQIMYSELGFNAIPWSENVKLNNTLRIEDEIHYFNYNPMWNFLGDEHYGLTCGAKGSYNIKKRGVLEWQFIDQIICSKEMIDKIDINNIKVIKTVTISGQTTDLRMVYILNKKEKYKYSDHYPICFTI